MGGELRTGVFDAFENAACKIVLLETGAHAADDFVPEFRIDFIVDAAVAEDHELTARGDDENQDAVAVGGVRDFQAREGCFSGAAHVADEKARDRDADFAGGAGLGLTDGVFEAHLVDQVHEFVARHHHEPLAPPPAWAALPPIAAVAGLRV